MTKPLATRPPLSPKSESAHRAHARSRVGRNLGVSSAGDSRLPLARKRACQRPSLARARQRPRLWRPRDDRPGTHGRKCPKPRQSPIIHGHPRPFLRRGRSSEIPANRALLALKLGPRAGALQAGGHPFDPGWIHRRLRDYTGIVAVRRGLACCSAQGCCGKWAVLSADHREDGGARRRYRVRRVECGKYISVGYVVIRHREMLALIQGALILKEDIGDVFS